MFADLERGQPTKNHMCHTGVYGSVSVLFTELQVTGFSDANDVLERVQHDVPGT